MIQIQHLSSSVPLRINFPIEWSVKDITDLDVAVYDSRSTVLLDSTTVTRWNTTTISADADIYTNEIALSDIDGNNPDVLVIGDKILISSISGDEIHTVKSYNSATQIVVLDEILQHSHSVGASVYGLFGRYNLDISDGDIFSIGMIVTIVWTPTGTTPVLTDLAQVAGTWLGSANFETEFGALFPRAYDSLTVPSNRLSTVYESAKRQVKTELLAGTPSLDIDRVVDQDLLRWPLQLACALNWTLNGDDDLVEERRHLLKQYDNAIAQIRALPIWSDITMDGVKDTGEVEDHDPYFSKGW